MTTTTTAVDKLMWFQKNMDRECECYAQADLHALVDKYLHRNDRDLVDLVKKAKSKLKGQRHNFKKEDDLRALIEAEHKSYVDGTFGMPLLADIVDWPI
jgi:hypothetical protein